MKAYDNESFQKEEEIEQSLGTNGTGILVGFFLGLGLICLFLTVLLLVVWKNNITF